MFRPTLGASRGGAGCVAGGVWGVVAVVVGVCGLEGACELALHVARRNGAVRARVAGSAATIRLRWARKGVTKRRISNLVSCRGGTLVCGAKKGRAGLGGGGSRAAAGRSR